ncbi:MAG: hypothetical protein R3B09_05390 [Nannocystaceae bacterium]
MRLVRSLALVLTLGVALGAVGPASARSCIRNAYERLQVERVGVFEGTQEVVAPPELEPLDTLYNSDGATGVLFWQERSMGFAKFYRLERTFPPTPAVAEYLEEARTRYLATSCGYPAAYTPIVPGRYLFEQEHGDGTKVSRRIAEPELWIAPGRDVLELRFRVGERRYRAVYKIVCADFKWTPKDEGRCAPTEVSEDLDQVFARAKEGASEPAGGSAVGSEAETPSAQPEPTTPEPATPEPATPEPAPLQRGCAVDEGGGSGLVFAAMVLAWRTRSRRRRRCAGSS